MPTKRLKNARAVNKSSAAGDKGDPDLSAEDEAKLSSITSNNGADKSDSEKINSSDSDNNSDDNEDAVKEPQRKKARADCNNQWWSKRGEADFYNQREET